MNATAFQKIPGDQAEQSGGWFQRQQRDAGTPIYDQLVAERGASVIDFMHSKIVTERTYTGQAPINDFSGPESGPGADASNDTEG